MLKFPDDRIGDHVLLEDGNGEPFLPRFSRLENGRSPWANYVNHWRPNQVLLQRYYTARGVKDSRTILHLINSLFTRKNSQC